MVSRTSFLMLGATGAATGGASVHSRIRLIACADRSQSRSAPWYTIAASGLEAGATTGRGFDGGGGGGALTPVTPDCPPPGSSWLGGGVATATGVGVGVTGGVAVGVGSGVGAGVTIGVAAGVGLAVDSGGTVAVGDGVGDGVGGRVERSVSGPAMSWASAWWRARAHRSR